MDPDQTPRSAAFGQGPHCLALIKHGEENRFVHSSCEVW